MYVPFHKKRFNVSYKRYPDEIVQKIDCTVWMNVIRFKGEIVKSQEKFEGEILMNPLTLRIGEGYYTHNNPEAYGTIKAIIKDRNTVLIDAPYVGSEKNKDGKVECFEVAQAFVWRREKK